MWQARDETGQTTVEAVALLPVLLVVALLCWQCVVAGQAVWLAGASARSAARAAAVGGDVRGAARSALPGGLRRGVRVVQSASGAVRVDVAVPLVLSGARLGHVTARARFGGAS